MGFGFRKTRRARGPWRPQRPLHEPAARGVLGFEHVAGVVQPARAVLVVHPEAAPPEHTWFYSDSHNDLPLLMNVGHPVAVDPDPTLRAHAESAGWAVMSLRG